MKKLLKITGILAVIFCLLVSLTGCGGNKLTGTFEDSKGKGKVVAKFDKDDKLINLVVTYTYKSKDDAKEAYNDMKESFEEVGTLKLSGKKMTLTIEGEKLKKALGNKDDALKKDNIKEFVKNIFDCELK